MFGWTTTGKEAPRRVAETSGAYETEPRFDGHALVAGTKVASGQGWRPVETIRRGDKVLTFDHGLQTVVEVRRTMFRTNPSEPRADRVPVEVPVGALGNRVPVCLLPGQGVLVESDVASDAMGDPFALVPAHCLLGYRGIQPAAASQKLVIVTLCFDKPQVIYAEAGLLAYCPQARVDLLDMARPTYELLGCRAAGDIVDNMMLEETSGTQKNRDCAGGVAA